jgi:S1-C subfamily serine protease
MPARRFFASLLAAGLLSLPLGLGASFLDVQTRIFDVFEANEDAVVRIKAAVRVVDEETGEPRVTLRVGTGFFISREGHVLANASVVYNAERVWFEHRNIPYAAIKIGRDLATNVSLLKAVTLPSQFHHVSLVEPAQLSRIGVQVISISCSLDFAPAPNLGMVTGHESSFGQRVFPTTYLRTNIPAFPGEGGSPLFDLNGRFIGMMVASLPEIGSSYVIPAHAAVRIRDDLLFSGEVRYPWLGIEVRERGDSARGSWLEIETVFPTGPAADAGLLPGDELIRVGDFATTRLNHLRDASFFSRVGQFAEIKVLRGGEERRFSVRLIERPEIQPELEVDSVDPNPVEAEVPPALEPQADHQD